MKQALLIIDSQQELIDGNEQESAVFHKDQLLTNINIAIQKAIQSNALIIFVRDTDVASGVGKGFQIHEEIKVPHTAQIIDKQTSNQFIL